MCRSHMRGSWFMHVVGQRLNFFVRLTVNIITLWCCVYIYTCNETLYLGMADMLRSHTRGSWFKDLS